MTQSVTVHFNTSLHRARRKHDWQVLAAEGPPGAHLHLSLLDGERSYEREAVLARAKERIENSDDLSTFIGTSGPVWIVNLDVMQSYLNDPLLARLSWMQGKAYVEPVVRNKQRIERGQLCNRYSVSLLITEEARTMKPASVAFTPPAIVDSLRKFQELHPDPMRAGFIMMKFGNTPGHNSLVAAIRDTLQQHGIKGLRADDHEFADDLFPNVQTYMHGCGFGIAVFERYEGDEFNPNVALEIGYMMAMNKPVCVLKDRTIRHLQSDLIGRLYKVFDPQDVMGTVREPLVRWLKERHIVGGSTVVGPEAASSSVRSVQARLATLFETRKYTNLIPLEASQHTLIDQDATAHAQLKKVDEHGVLVAMRKFQLGNSQRGLYGDIHHLIIGETPVEGTQLVIPWDFIESATPQPNDDGAIDIHLSRRVLFDVVSAKWRLV